MIDYSLDALEADLGRSAASGESPHQWWDRAHGSNHLYWLSDTPGPEVWARLGVEDLLVHGARVLNVGVGMGRCTRELADRGCLVSVLDISPAAVERVADVAAGYLATELDGLPVDAFDVALSHLVAQHMSDQDLESQIRAVVRSLSTGGVAAIQYATNATGVPTDDSLPHNVKSGNVRRTEDGFHAIVDRAGGRLLRTLERESHPCGTVWRVAHIGR
jgi:2-polyprenyl-3-methyl-5-hydroxy-6-metoxy-1,4-benzoquinol methylase